MLIPKWLYVVMCVSLASWIGGIFGCLLLMVRVMAEKEKADELGAKTE